MEETSNKMKEFMEDCWKDVFLLVKNAAVYLDHTAAECLHWYSGDKGFRLFREAGAIATHELAMYNSRNVRVKEARKAVVICTSANPAFYRRTLRMIIDNNSFDACTIICGVHSSVLNYGSKLPGRGANDYDELKGDVLTWMRVKHGLNSNREPEVEILFRPIFTASIDENLFVTPCFGELMPPIGESQISDDLETDLDHLVSSLHSMFSNFNVKEDIYSLGDFSEYVADKLEHLPAAVDRRKRLIGKTGVSLIFVDRTLDLCCATSHNTESLLGRILSTLPHLPHHFNDVAVDMSPICPESGVSSSMAPGCLASEDYSMMNLLITKKPKEILLALHKMLVDMSIIKSSPKTRITTRISAHSLEKMINKCPDIENIESLTLSSKKLQQIIAVIQALKSDKTPQIELLISLEKLILQNLAVSRDSSSVLAQISNIIKTRATRGLEMDNLLALLVHIYSLSGTEIKLPEQQEKQLELALAEAILEDIKKCNELTPGHEISVFHQTLLLLALKLGANGNDLAKEYSAKITQNIMDMLHAISKARKGLLSYRSVMRKVNPQEMAQNVGILQQLTTDLLNPNKPEIPDLKYKSSSLISAGFNLLLKGRVKQHPIDNPWIIIFVLGGVTAEESRIVQDIASTRRNNQRVTLAGSRLLSPLDVAERILLTNVDI